MTQQLALQAKLTGPLLLVLPSLLPESRLKLDQVLASCEPELGHKTLKLAADDLAQLRALLLTAINQRLQKTLGRIPAEFSPLN